MNCRVGELRLRTVHGAEKKKQNELDVDFMAVYRTVTEKPYYSSNILKIIYPTNL